MSFPIALAVTFGGAGILTAIWYGIKRLYERFTGRDDNGVEAFVTLVVLVMLTLIAVALSTVLDPG